MSVAETPVAEQAPVDRPAVPAPVPASEPALPIDTDELSDEEFAYEVGIGALIGIPVVFVLFFALLLATIQHPEIAPAAAWAALVGGGYFGGFVAISRAMAKHEQEARARR